MKDDEVKDLEASTEKKKKKKSILRILIERNKIGFIILVFFTLTANAFAWFIYSQIVSSEISAKVKAWNISMTGEQDGVIEFDLDDLYPGMTTYSESVELSNTGDLDARVTFTVHSITIMGETHSIEDPEYANLADPATALDTYIRNTYPFVINYSTTDTVIAAETGHMDLNFSVSWAYESGDDDLDTYWGEKAYEYAQAHPGEDMLHMVLDVHVIQLAS